jgi:hypothetical protein
VKPPSTSSSAFTAVPASRSQGECALQWRQHEHPKLTAMAVNGETFAAMLDRAIARSQAPLKQIEHDPKETAEGITWTGPLRDGG